ncbi:ribonuclease H-like domain-containing protein [Tanacetum coccineum]
MAVEDDIVKTSDNTKIISSSSDLSLSFGDSLYLHPNDTGGSPIMTIKLIGTKNYKMWGIAMKFALRNHNKLGFIDGTCKRDDKNVAFANQWDMCNSVVDTYDKVGGSVVFNLHKSINLNQDGASLADYYNNLNSLWKQFDAMISLPPSTFLQENGEESHRNVTSGGTTKPAATAFAAKTFDKKRCFELAGYPTGCVKRNFNSNTRLVSSNNASADVHSNNDLKENMTVRIGKQYNGLYLFDVDNAYSVDQVLNALKTTLDIDSHSTSDHLCDTCNKAKQTREPFPLSKHKSTKIGELVHSDLSPDIQGNGDSEATFMDENNNTRLEGIVPNETDFVNDFYENSEFNSEVEDLPVHTVRMSSRHTKLPTSLHDFVIDGKVKYGVEIVVNYANMNHENF